MAQTDKEGTKSRSDVAAYSSLIQMRMKEEEMDGVRWRENIKKELQTGEKRKQVMKDGFKKAKRRETGVERQVRDGMN